MYIEQEQLRRSEAFACDERFVNLSQVEHLSKSQDKEDMFLISNFFKGLCGGTYLELGGLDGVTFSNSHLFEFAFDWSGVLIEPNPSSFAKLQKNRPNNHLHHAAICDSVQTVHFLSDGHGAVSGVYEFMAPSFRKQWHPSINAKNLEEGATKVSCKPLKDILSSDFTKPKHIDFLSLDVEGAEFEVLKTIDFTKQQFGVVFYEADGHNPKKNEMMKTWLESEGYIFRSHALRSNFHVHSRFHEIYYSTSS